MRRNFCGVVCVIPATSSRARSLLILRMLESICPKFVSEPGAMRLSDSTAVPPFTAAPLRVTRARREAFFLLSAPPRVPKMTTAISTARPIQSAGFARMSSIG